MENPTERYLEQVEKLSLDRSVPLGQIIKAYNVSKRKPEKHKIIREALTKHYLKSVGSVAKRISTETKVDLDELIGEANLYLSELFTTEKNLRQDINFYIRNNVERKLKRYALNKISENLLKEERNHTLCNEVKDEETRFNIYQVKDLIEGLKETLTEREREVLILRFGLIDGQPKTLEEVGEVFQVNRERIRQIEAKVLRKLRNSHHSKYSLKVIWESINFQPNFGIVEETTNLVYDKTTDTITSCSNISLEDRLRSFKHNFQGTFYSLDFIENLDEELMRKQGIGLSDLVRSFNSNELARFVKRVCGFKMDASQQEEIFSKYGISKNRKICFNAKQRKEFLEDLRSKIIANLGITPREFMAYFNMSQENFVDFIGARFPGLKESDIRKVMVLDEKEKPTLSGPSRERIEMSELELLERVLYLLQHDRYNQYFPNTFEKITDKLKHALFPLYINDIGKCFKLLEDKIATNQHNNLYKYFKEVYNFFKKSLDINIERLKTPLDDFQKVDIITLAEKGRYILGSETGVGKSLEIIATAEYLAVDKVLISTNKSSTVTTWGKEIKKHLGDEAVVITGDDKDKENLFEKAKNSKWIICTYETYRSFFEKFRELNPKMVVIDEADIMNNPSSLRTKAILNTNAKYKYCVSGWIFKNKRSELWPILHWLHPEEYPSRKQFVVNYCRNEWGRLKLKYELSHKLIYRPKSLVLPDLPHFDVRSVPIKMNQKEDKEYAKIERDFIKWYKKNNKGELPVGIAITKLHSLRKAALKPKFPKLHSLIKKDKKSNKKVIFCSYLDEAMQIAEDLSKDFNVCYLDGKSGARERHETIDRFNNDPTYGPLVITKVGGSSIELVSANKLYVFSPEWTYHFMKQLIDRLHRRGQKNEVNVYNFITQGTLEESIVKRTKKKKEEYEKTVIDTFGYTSWFEENQEDIIRLVIGDIVNKN